MLNRRRIGTILIFLGYRFTKKGKQKKTKFIIPAPIISATSIFIILSFSALTSIFFS